MSETVWKDKGAMMGGSWGYRLDQPDYVDWAESDDGLIERVWRLYPDGRSETVFIVKVQAAASPQSVVEYQTEEDARAALGDAR